MADVKFMDLSQNDNPATTDSVLIGNSTDGLKRTTVGAIGNLFAVKGLLHFETITGSTDPTNTNIRAAKIRLQSRHLMFQDTHSLSGFHPQHVDQLHQAILSMLIRTQQLFGLAFQITMMEILKIL
ncbi:hypothetical protein ACIUDV_05850 [Limosilactobacillus reuteri]|uniref:hypothetical protein n=1 Tax=Limosilactobacillus reuteri TaxID=1598 RepID=UPI00386E4CE0